MTDEGATITIVATVSNADGEMTTTTATTQLPKSQTRVLAKRKQKLGDYKVSEVSHLVSWNPHLILHQSG